MEYTWLHPLILNFLLLQTTFADLDILQAKSFK